MIVPEIVNTAFSTPYMDVNFKMKDLHCNKCSYATDSKSELKRHENGVHLGLKPYKCDFCSYPSSYKSELKRHTRVKHASKPHPCRDCSSAFEEKSELSRHKVENHWTENQLVLIKCDSCDHKATRSKLFIHIGAVHLGLKP